jgi:two-component system, OmpR family, aerobic respiration control sensor histidine kinase ArcB
MLYSKFFDSLFVVNLSDIITALPGYVFLKDKASHYIGCNYRAAKLCKLSDPENIKGKTDYDLTWSKEFAKQFIAEDKKVVTEKKTITQVYNLPIKRKDKQYVSIRSKKIPLYGSDREIVGILIIATDITDAKLDELTSLETLIEYLPCNVYWMNTDFTMARCNRNVLAMLGMSRLEEFVGKTYEELAQFCHWPESLSQKLKNDDLQVLKTGQPIINVEDPPIPHANGGNQYLLTNRVPIKNKSGQVIGIAGISVDISARKVLEEKLRASKEKAEIANKAKTEFLENMRHDIRTPLSGIVGCAHLIKLQANNPEKVTEYASDLIHSSDALLDFLNKILESIQVSSGEIPLLKRRFDLHQILEQIIQLHKPEAHIKHLTLELDYDKTIPAYLLGDPIRVQRIILELVTNALKFTDKGGVKITARLEKNKTQAGQMIVSLSVSDTGIGIPLAQQNEVYTRFKRLTPSYQGIYPGTGLGLAVVKQFIDELGGEIQLDSNPNQGSTFTCLIPFQESLSVKGEREEPPSVVANTQLSSKKVLQVVSSETSVKTGSRILVVEDNPIAKKVAQGILSGLNYHADIVEDGKTALTAIEKNKYDLILMDVGLPDGDGCELTRRIRLKQWQRNPSVPIIGFTAHINEEKKRACLKNGMNAVYTKPLTGEKAAEILNAFLSHPQLSDLTEEKSETELTSWPILDKDQALKLLNSKEMVNEMLVLLENELTKELGHLKQHHQSHNWAAIRELAHKWQGGASYCGARRLVKACQQLEVSLRQKDPKEETEKLYQQLLVVAEATKEAAKKAISSK